MIRQEIASSFQNGVHLVGVEEVVVIGVGTDEKRRRQVTRKFKSIRLCC